MIPRSLTTFCREVVPQLHRETSGKRILGGVRDILTKDIWNSFDRFHETTRMLVNAFESTGAATDVHEVQTGGPVGNGRWIIHEAEDVRAATVDVVKPIRQRLLDYKQNPWHVIQWTGATPKQGVRCKLAIFDTEEALDRLRPEALRGKMVLTRLDPKVAGPKAYEKGAIGILVDKGQKNLPGATPWLKFGWGRLPVESAYARPVGLVLSSRDGKRLRRLVDRHGTLTLHVKVDAYRYAGSHDVISGLVRGAGNPQDEIWAIAHSAEPGALDNASGVAACVEIARVLESLIQRGMIPRPLRTIRLVAGYECYGFFHLLEHGKRLQPPMAGVCIDSIGAKPSASDGYVGWYETVAASAGFVDDIGEIMLRRALRIERAGYKLQRRPFVPTLDTLIGDPKYGFPCPWISTRSGTSYHSSADTCAVLSSRGLSTCTSAMAGYLYYLANMTTREIMEIGAWQTKRTLSTLAGAKRSAPGKVEFLQARHREHVTRLKRWAWGGEHMDITRRCGEWEQEVQTCARSMLRSAPRKRRPSDSAARLVARRTALLAPSPNNTPVSVSNDLQRSGIPLWAHYWADGERDLHSMAELIAVETGKPVAVRQVAQHLRALQKLDYVELIEPNEQITKTQLIRDLKRLGVQRGMYLMVHSALSKVGHIRGGAEALLDSILSVIGPRATLMLPSFNHFEAKVYNPLATPTTNGALPDVGWRRAEAVRSFHPSHAVACIGPKAERWCEGHLQAGAFGIDSPLDRLIREGGFVLGLGLNCWTATAYHIAEISMPCGCMDLFGRTMPAVMQDGAVVSVPAMAWRSKACPIPAGSLIDKALDRRKLQRHGKVGKADSFLVRAEDVYRLRRRHLRNACPKCKIKPS